MDNLTHTLAGMAIGEAFFRDKHGRRAVTASAWAANLPDIDVAALLLQDRGAILLRRSFGHSLFLAPLWSAGLAWVFKRKYPDFRYADLCKIVGVNVAGHLFLDFINSFGVQFLWPFTVHRAELAITFIIDLFLLACFAAPHLARLSKAWRPRLREAARAGLATAALYLLASFGLRARAVALLKDARPDAEFSYVFPEPFGPTRWRGVARKESEWTSYLIQSFSGTVSARELVDSEDAAPAVVAARQSPFGRRLLTFFLAPVWTVTPGPDGGVVASVRDLRFSSLLLRRGGGFGFAFDVGPDGRAVPRGVKLW